MVQRIETESAEGRLEGQIRQGRIEHDPRGDADRLPLGGVAQPGNQTNMPGFDPGADDPWIHRSRDMRCRSCMFFVAKQLDPPPLCKLDARGALGRCRRHAPTMSGFPAVFAADWCGDHKLDETKV